RQPAIYALSLHDALPISDWACSPFLTLVRTPTKDCTHLSREKPYPWAAELTVLESPCPDVSDPDRDFLLKSSLLLSASASRCRKDRKSTRLNSSHVAISY